MQLTVNIFAFSLMLLWVIDVLLWALTKDSWTFSKVITRYLGRQPKNEEFNKYQIRIFWFAFLVGMLMAHWFKF